MFFTNDFKKRKLSKSVVKRKKWVLAEIEKEFRAQIKLTKQNIPSLTHISDHMMCVGFSKDISKITSRLAKEYGLKDYTTNPDNKHHVVFNWWLGAHKTYQEKETTFIKMVEAMIPGKVYLFVEHPAYDNAEMVTVGHIRYENVATDRQGGTDLFTNSKIKKLIIDKNIKLISYNEIK